MIINTNMNALNAHRNMGINNTAAGKSMEKLSSGSRINRAGDDAAGLAISEKMRGQIRGLDQASRNAQDGVSMIQTAEGALNETHSIIQRMRELSVQAGTDTNTDVDRAEMQKEIEQLTQEVDRIANTTEFNTQKLLNGNKYGAAGTEIEAAVTAVTGSFTVDLDVATLTTGSIINVGGKSVTITTAVDALTQLNSELGAEYTITGSTQLKFEQKAPADQKGIDITVGGVQKTLVTSVTGVQAKASVASEGKLSLQVGANKDQTMELEIKDMRASALNISTDGKSLSVLNSADANKAVESFDKALNTVSAERSKLGAIQNRLEYTTSNLNNTSENLTAAESRIRDVDMAKEMLNFSKNNILNQAAQSMLAQAKSQPEGVLQLLR